VHFAQCLQALDQKFEGRQLLQTRCVSVGPWLLVSEKPLIPPNPYFSHPRLGDRTRAGPSTMPFGLRRVIFDDADSGWKLIGRQSRLSQVRWPKWTSCSEKCAL